MNRSKNFIGENFWARGYYVSTQGKMRRLYGDTYNSRKRKIAGLTS